MHCIVGVTTPATTQQWLKTKNAEFKLLSFLYCIQWLKCDWSQITLFSAPVLVNSIVFNVTVCYVNIAVLYFISMHNKFKSVLKLPKKFQAMAKLRALIDANLFLAMNRNVWLWLLKIHVFSLFFVKKKREHFVVYCLPSQVNVKSWMFPNYHNNGVHNGRY